MHATALTSRRLRTAALALLLVCAQALALGHETTHGVDAEQDSCTICSIGGALKHAAAAAETPTLHPPTPATFDADRAAPARPNPVQGPEARAPPVHS